jgi:NADP oxidoreductase coenzyme F420-dependent
MKSRRQFLRTSALVGAPLLVRSKVFSADAPSNRINVGFIGTGNQGMGLLKRFLDADLENVLAVCDVNEGNLFNTATETRFRCLYENGVELVCESGPESVQTRFEGTDGWLQTGYKGATATGLG